MTSDACQTLVTIAVPTYRRPRLLSRALEGVARQTYSNLEVLVADNATEGFEVEDVVASFRSRLPGLVSHRHATNIGAVNNFLYCLERAKGRYFMWLADDDELSPTAVEAMVQVLEHDPVAVTAVPHWLLKRGPQEGSVILAGGYESNHRLVRAIQFVWRSDDAFFYALHRVTVLRQARRIGYVWPNRQILSNWAYPYLLDMVLAGKVVPVERSDALWINHEYSEKTYERPTGGLFNLFRQGARRLNVHAIYVSKVFAAAGAMSALVVAAVSCASLVTEVAKAMARKFRHRFAKSHVAMIEREGG